MRNWTLLPALFIGLQLSAQDAEWTSIKDINPFIGTGGHGHTHPSAQAPFGMIQLGPNTRYDGWDGVQRLPLHRQRDVWLHLHAPQRYRGQ